MSDEHQAASLGGAASQNQVRIEKLTAELLGCLGEDPQREGLIRTPLRVAKAWDELTAGYHQNLSTILNDAVFEEDANEMVLVQDIEVYSLCEHHLLPFFGKCHVAYIPNGKVVGLSKLPRIVDMFARRLQVQERLTTQIADAVNEVLQPLGVAVICEAVHLCMMMRGVQKQNSITKTSAMLGAFRNDSKTRAELLGILGHGK
ncbi:MAG: GTP cyclohydrolase I FolE [Planctomycetes bacterium]|nr:GTP cyclohydrolase I FolE [Planctomycetota bacterium]